MSIQYHNISLMSIREMYKLNKTDSYKEKKIYRMTNEMLTNRIGFAILNTLVLKKQVAVQPAFLYAIEGFCQLIDLFC